MLVKNFIKNSPDFIYGKRLYFFLPPCYTVPNKTTAPFPSEALMKYILERLSHQSIGCGSYAYKDTHSRDGQIFLPIDTPKPYALYSKAVSYTHLSSPLGQGICETMASITS